MSSPVLSHGSEGWRITEKNNNTNNHQGHWNCN